MMYYEEYISTINDVAFNQPYSIRYQGGDTKLRHVTQSKEK